MTTISLTQFETRHRMLEAERELLHTRAASRRVVPVERPRRPRRLLRALLAAATASQ
jgi:hypothetical protein